MHADIPNLTIATTTAGTIELEQQNGLDEPDRIEIHPIHLRYMAEQIGLAPTSDPTAARTITTLRRRLILLRDRCAHLAEYLALYSDYEHADLSHEQDYSEATFDLADEFCADFEPSIFSPTKDAPPSLHREEMAETTPKPGALNTTENGAIESPQERVRSLFE
jgi:hypothetical protein